MEGLDWRRIPALAALVKSLPRRCLLLACMLLAGCVRGPAPEPADASLLTQSAIAPEEGGAVSRAPVVVPEPVAAPASPKAAVLWPITPRG